MKLTLLAGEFRRIKKVARRVHMQTGRIRKNVTILVLDDVCQK